MKENSVEVTSKSKFFAYFEKYMFCVGILGQLLYYMQGIKIFLTHSAKDVSIVGFLLGLISVSSWLIYGVLIKNRVLIVANIFAVIGALFVIFGVLVYGY